MVQKVNFNNLTGDTLTVGNTVITGTGVTVGGSELGAGGATVYANASVLPTTGLTAGDFAYTGNAIFITNGSGWYRVAVTNQDPSLTLSATSASLTGNNSVVDFTYTASDADGTTPTITVTNSGFSSTSTATIQHFTGNNTIRLTNLANTDYSGTITVTASDGISTGFGTFTATISATVEYSAGAFPWGNTVISVGTSDTTGLSNDTFIDRSSNQVTVGITNDPIQSAFHPYLDEYSVDFGDATQNCAIIFGGGGVDTGTGDFTIEGWYYLYDLSQSYAQMFHGNGGQFLVTSSGTVYLWAGYSHQTNIEAGRWYHIALMRDNGVVKWYIDGVAASSSLTNNTDYNIDSVSRDHASESWNGLVSNFRMSNVARYSASGFTPPTTSFTSDSDTLVLTCNSNRFVDQSSNEVAITLTTTNQPKISATQPFGQDSEYSANNSLGSVYLDGSSCVESGSTINPSSGCCIEGWMYLTTVSSYGFIFSTEQGNPGFYPRWYVGHDNSGNWRVSPGDATDNNLTSYPVTKNQWNHWALTNDGSTSRLFVNGKLIYTKSVTPTSESLNINISKYGDSNSYGFYGYISDFRAATTIPTDYQTSSTTLGTQVFTPPTSAGGASGAGYYLPFDNAGIFDKTGNCTLIPKGTFSGMSDPVTSTANTAGIATSSIIFNNRPLYLEANDSDSFGKISGDFTVEFWAECNSTGQACILFDNHPSSYGGSFNMRSDYVTGTNSTMYGSVRGLNFSFSYTVADFLNTPAHWAINCTSNAVKIYLNGTQKYSGTCSGTSDITDGFYIGGAAGPTSGYSNLVGLMEGFQLINGVGKYTSAFTAPSQEQGRTYQLTS